VREPDDHLEVRVRIREAAMDFEARRRPAGRRLRDDAPERPARARGPGRQRKIEREVAVVHRRDGL
jgi:hypothetical protein